MTEPSSQAASPLPETGAVAITDRVLVRVTGGGTDKFLHGQFSQNLEDVTDQASPRAAACNPKGRTYCLTRLARQGDDVLLDLPRELSESILTQLRKYLMLFRGTSMAPIEEGKIFGLLGHSLARQLSPLADERLKADGDTLRLEDGLLIRTGDTAEGLSRYEFWQTARTPEAIARAPEISLATWQASEIAAGIPQLTQPTQEQYVPQMLNWQHLNGVHFRKGCYTGQEVIARMHFLGQLKKSLYRLSASPGHLPEPGALVFAGEKSCGEVINAVAPADGSMELLAVLRHAAAEGPMTLEDGTALQVMPLPYTVTERIRTESADT